MKLGFVSRSNPTQKSQHQILSSQFYKPREFARQINLNLDNMWGIIRYVVDLVKKQPSPGKYVLLKDPNKQILLFYKVPQNTFEDDSDSDEDDDGDDDSDEDGEEGGGD